MHEGKTGIQDLVDILLCGEKGLDGNVEIGNVQCVTQLIKVQVGPLKECWKN